MVTNTPFSPNNPRVAWNRSKGPRTYHQCITHFHSNRHLTHVNPKSLFLKLYIDIFKSNPTSQVDSSIGNNDINTLYPLFLDLLDRLLISPIPNLFSEKEREKRVPREGGEGGLTFLASSFSPTSNLTTMTSPSIFILEGSRTAAMTFHPFSKYALVNSSPTLFISVGDSSGLLEP
jgi:hypothetical protein